MQLSGIPQSGQQEAREAPVAIFLMGPTASGKTGLALRLVERLPCDIVSVDSALVYRDMNIGTAKPGPEELARAPHRLIDICTPTEAYSAARFRSDALREMENISAQGRIPLLVGGTMLYFRALQYGLSELPEADAETRIRLENEARSRGWGAMHERLTEVDPESAARIHRNDPQRIQRALEVFDLTGTPLSKLQRNSGRQRLPYRLVKLALGGVARTLLHERIETRFRAMLAAGFEEEVRSLLARYPLEAGMPSMRTVGYRQMLGYIHGQHTHEEMIYRGVVATRQLAKRQMTWLRRESGTHWLDSEDPQMLTRVLNIIAGVTI